MKCKTCGKNAESEYCFQHKPRKPLLQRKNVLSNTLLQRKVVKDRKISDRNEFFLQIWNKRKQHNCENCGKWLGSEPLSYMFDHLLEKSKFPDLEHVEENIMLVCLECHDNKTRGFLTELVKEKIKIVKEKFGK